MFLREVLERRPRLRLLLVSRVDALRGEERAGLGGDLERLARLALRRELEDPRAVRIEPHLGDQPAVVALGRVLQLEDEERAEDREVVERDPVGRVLGEERPLLLREELAQRPLARDGFLHVAGRGHPFIDPEQTNPPGDASTSTPKLGERRISFGSSDGTTGRSFTTESSPFSATAWHARRGPACRAPNPACRGRTPGGSPPAADRGRAPARSSADLASGTVSFNSTLSAPLISPRSCCSSSSPSAGAAWCLWPSLFLSREGRCRIQRRRPPPHRPIG